MAVPSTGLDSSQIPLALNPNGDPPNFEGGPTLQPVILVTGIIFIIISVIVVAVRLGTNLKNTGRLCLDDYFCLLAEIAGVGYWAVFYGLQVKNGIAKHSWDVAASSLTPTVLKSQVAAQILVTFAHATGISSIPAFFLRLFGTLRWVRVACYGLLTLIFILYGSLLIILLVFCIPSPGHGWDGALLERCTITTAPSIVVAVFAVLIDITIFAMPFFIIAGLNTKPDRKRSLAIVFIIGFLIVVTSIVGLAYRIIVASGTPDPLWNGANVSITAYTEIFGTIIVSCTPALSAFWLGTLLKTRVYSSIRSKISRARLQDTSEAKTASTPLRSRDHSTSTRDFMEEDMQLHAIQKTTLITQQTLADIEGLNANSDSSLAFKHPYREQW